MLLVQLQGGERMTKSMEQIHRVKELQMQEFGPYQIAKEVGMDRKRYANTCIKRTFSKSTIYSAAYL
jgi:hypothetical protein